MGKLSKTARASGATGVTKSRGPARVRPKNQIGHRAVKGKRCPYCNRNMKRGATVCQFHKRWEE